MFFGGSGGVPPGGSGAPAWQIPGTRGLLGRSEGATSPIFPKSGQNTHFWQFWGSGGYPQGFWGPRLADSRDPGPPGPVRGGDPANFPENLPKHTFSAVLGVWGVPPGVLGPQAGRFQGTGASWACPRGRPRQFSRKAAKTHIFDSFGGLGGTLRGSGAPGWQIPGTRDLLGLSEGATPPIFPKSGRNTHFRQFCGLGGTPRGSGAPGWQIPGTRGFLGLSEGATPPIRGHNTQVVAEASTRVWAPGWRPGAFWAGPSRQPRQPACPALSPGLKREKSFFACFRATLTGCERRSVCWEPLLLVERPAQAARTHNPTVIHFSSVLL